MHKSVLTQIIAFILMLVTNNFRLMGQTYSLEQCKQDAAKNYPLIRQSDLLAKVKDYSLENAGKQWLPQFGIFGQFTYQSEVTSLPIAIPNVSVPELSKSQFKLYAELNQTLYDGGMTSLQKQEISLNKDIEEAKLAVDLHTVMERVQSAYFGILMLQERLALLQLSRQDLEAGRDKVKAAYEAGTALESQVLSMEVELLNLEQRKTELNSARLSYISVLNALCASTYSENGTFLLPADAALSTESNRPELSLIDLQQRRYDLKYRQIGASINPRLSFFVQGGLGRPGLNMLNNDVRMYGIGGLRFSMPLNTIYSQKNDRSLIQTYRESLNVQRDIFNLNNGIRMTQAKNDMDANQSMMRRDEAILDMRVKIKNTALAQLESGTITTADYIREVNAEETARLNLSIHRLQNLSATYQYNQLTEK